jgi:FkbM family methyltransferase
MLSRDEKVNRTMRTIKRQIDSWLFEKKGEQFCRYFNLLNRFYWKYPITLSWSSDHQKILVEDDGGKRLFIARTRRVRRYDKGITAKLDALTGEYLLNRIAFDDGDCVIDCGANIGEIGIVLKRFDRIINIISVEPEREEAECCDLNVYGGEKRTIRKALWSEVGERILFSKNESGDSSLFEIDDYESSAAIQTTTLATLIEEMNLSKIKLLKLEAEGAEPEILVGAKEHLDKIEYISADLGPERGLSQESTAAPAINFLLARNFRLIDVYSDRVTCLFKNIALG